MGRRLAVRTCLIPLAVMILTIRLKHPMILIIPRIPMLTSYPPRPMILIILRIPMLTSYPARPMIRMIMCSRKNPLRPPHAFPPLPARAGDCASLCSASARNEWHVCVL